MIIFDLAALANDEHRRHFIDPSKNSDYQYVPSFFPSSGSLKNYVLSEPLWEHKATKEKFQPDYQAYYDACDKDEPVEPVITLWNKYEVEIACDRVDIEIWSGRLESIKQKTIEWLWENQVYNGGGGDYEEWFDGIIKMRPIDDTRPQEQLFEEWLDSVVRENRTVEFVFSAHGKTIEMFRRRGVFVFDCNQGE